MNIEIDFRALATPEDRRDYLFARYNPRLRKPFSQWTEQEIKEYYER